MNKQRRKNEGVYMAGIVGKQRDILVEVEHGLDEYDIKFIQQIEAAIDAALSPLGFSRSETEKGSAKCTLVYFQFGRAL